MRISDWSSDVCSSDLQTLIHQYGERLRRLLEAGKAQGELDAQLDVDAAAVLFIGTIQGLVMQSLIAGDVAGIRRDAPRAFAIYLRGIKDRKSTRLNSSH